MTMTGEAVDARRAHEVGLVNRLVPTGRVLDEALALAATIAALSPLAVSVVKHVVRLAATSPAEAAALSAELVPMVFDSDDAREGATAFVERRDPVWTGRPWTPGD
jgi:enoyl-CoA hydratase